MGGTTRLSGSPGPNCRCFWLASAKMPCSFERNSSGVTQFKTFVASRSTKMLSEVDVPLHCRRSPAFARTMKDLGVHGLGSGSLALTCRFNPSARPKSQAQSSNFAEFVTFPHHGRMSLLQTPGFVCAAHHRSVASSSDSLPARFEKPRHVGENSTAFRGTPKACSSIMRAYGGCGKNGEI